jgi:deoxyribose-phosphate aldolase
MNSSALIPFIDLTTLQGTDNDLTAKQIVIKGLALKEKGILPASICVFPTLVKNIVHHSSHQIRVASVAGGFPAGLTPTDIKCAETKFALEQGADEIDIVINRGKLMEGEDAFVLDEITRVKETCGNKILKVIIESGELQTEELIKKASRIALDAGADFLKTSTGKVPIGATPEAAQWMSEVLLEHYKKTSNKRGLKLSGGIANKTAALQYIDQVRNLLGPDWIQPDLFRIGASKLFDELVMDVTTNNN